MIPVLNAKMLCEDGKISLFAFLGTASVFCAVFLNPTSLQFFPRCGLGCALLPVLYYVVANVVIRFFYSKRAYQVCTTRLNRLLVITDC